MGCCVLFMVLGNVYTRELDDILIPVNLPPFDGLQLVPFDSQSSGY